MTLWLHTHLLMHGACALGIVTHRLLLSVGQIWHSLATLRTDGRITMLSIWGLVRGVLASHISSTNYQISCSSSVLNTLFQTQWVYFHIGAECRIACIIAKEQRLLHRFSRHLTSIVVIALGIGHVPLKKSVGIPGGARMTWLGPLLGIWVCLSCHRLD